jgi:hypothetical protein
VSFRQGKATGGGGAGSTEMFVFWSRFTVELLHSEKNPFMKIRAKVHLNVHGVSQVGEWEEKHKHADRYEILAWTCDFILDSQSLVLQGHIQSNDNILEH